MHINVRDILRSDIGETVVFRIDGEQPDLADIVLTEPVSGQVTLAKTETGLSLAGQLSTAVELECHRCLRKFSHPLTVRLTAEFADKSTADRWPIAADLGIDLAPIAREELLLRLPIQQLCQPDCAGLCAICGGSLTEVHNHPAEIVPSGPKPKIIIKD